MNAFMQATMEMTDADLITSGSIAPQAEADLPPYRFVHALETRVEALFRTVTGTGYWNDLICPVTSDDRSQAILREMLLSIHWYQAHTAEASDIMFSRLPRKKLRTLDILRLQREQKSERGRWAFGDYLALGGTQVSARMLPPDPAIFAVTSVWWHMAEVEDPWAYLGAEYLFEYLTVKIAGPLLEMCTARHIDTEPLHFLREHGASNLNHAQLIRELIVETATRFPNTEASILRGLDYFQQVYPLPLWDAAYRRTLCAPGQTYRDPWLRYVDGLKPGSQHPDARSL